MIIFVDKATGTWGVAHDVVLIEASNEALDNLDSMSDSEIVEWADAVETLSSIPELIDLHDFFSGKWA